jgi:glutathione S-transferase/RNA polymerase-associated protein
MLKLYEHPLSPYAQKVKLSLIEKGVPFQVQTPDFLSGDPEFQALSPRREVPTLVDGSTTVFDSTIILEYLEDKWPTPPMLPETPAERAQARMLEEICDTYYEAINWAVYEIRIFGRARGAQAEALIARAGEQVAGVNAFLDRQLGAREYFNGKTFGWGDLAVVPAVNAAATSGFAPREGSHLARWLDRVRARPSVERVVAAALESMAGFAMVPQLIESGMFVREYRDHRLEWMMRSGAAQVVLDGMERGTIRFSVELA